MVLPAAEFALNSTRNAATGYAPAFVVYGRDPVLPLESAVRDVVDTPVQSVADRVHAMHRTIDSVRKSLDEAAEYMTSYANQRRRAADVTLGNYAWLNT